MRKRDVTDKQLFEELAELRHRLAEFEKKEIEHRRVDEALKESEAKFRKITEKSVVGVYLIQDGLFKYVNPRLAQIFGYNADEIINKKSPKDLTFPDDWPAVDKNLSKRIPRESEVLSVRFRGLTKDAQVVHVEVFGSHMEYRGRPAVIGTLLDITDRILVKNDLENELTKFRALYDLALAMTAERSLEENLALLVEKSRTLLGADKAFIALRDEEAGDLYMHTLSGIVTEEFKRLRIPFGVGLGGKVAETGQWHIVEDYFQEIGPAFHDVVRAEELLSGIAVPIKIGDQNLGVLYAFNKARTPFSNWDLDTLSLLGNLAAVEITRRRAEEKFRESEKRYRMLYEESKRREELYVSLLNSSADAIVIYDMEGRAQYVNPSFTRIFGWDFDEIRGQRIPFLPDSERATTMQIIAGLIQDGTPTTGFETVRYTKSGNLLNISISASRYHDLEGNPAGTLVILRDITDRKQAERRLRDSEAKYRELYEESKKREELYVSVLNSSADAIVIYDMEGRAQYVNPSFTRIFGWTSEEVLGKRIPFLPESEREASMAIIEGLIKDGKPCSAFETKRYTKEGNLLNISISASRYHDHEGRPAGLLVILRNITARKKAETALRESEERFRTLAEVAPFGLAVISSREQVEYLNPKFTEIFGYTLEDIPTTDRWFLRTYPDKEQKIAASSIWRSAVAATQNGYPGDVEAYPNIFSVKSKSGSEKIVGFKPVILADGRIIATFLDITAETKAQEEIVQAKNEWERTFNAVSDPIVILDREHKVVQANKAMLDRLRIVPQDLVGRHYSQFFTNETVKVIEMKTSSSETRFSVEIFDQTLGGVFDLSVFPVRDDQDKPPGWVLVARDVTTVRSMERARRLAVHHLSHELKTPLAIIKGSLKDLDNDTISAKAKEIKIERIRRSLDRLSDIQHIVKEIVEPAKCQPTEFNTYSIAANIVKEIETKSARRSISIVLRVEEATIDFIDPKVFELVLRSLIKNAIENTPDEGEIIVSLENSTFGILLSVEDTGVGIPASDRDFLFTAFHHTQDTERYATKKPFDFGAGGKGLELMRLKILAEQCNFEIAFESRRCKFIPSNLDQCPGKISMCAAADFEKCKAAGGTVFSVLFHRLQ